MTPPSLDACIPAGATFRRAVGLDLRLALCDRGAAVEARAQRADEPTTTTLARDDAALLFRMSRWRTADELGAPRARLVELVARDLAYWSSGRPREDLTGAPLGDALWDDGAGVALARNVWPEPLVARGGEVYPFPFMPRRGELDGAALAGVDFSVVEMDERTHVASVACCERHGALLRDLLPRLDGRRAARDVAGDDPEAREALALLDDLGLLERFRPDETADAPPPPPPRVTWYAHAAVLYESAGGARLFVDPLFHRASVPSRRGADVPPDPRAVGPVDAVLITHGDNDHLSPRSLARFARATRVVAPRAAREHDYQVDVAGILRVMGFADVTWLSPWERATVGDVEVLAAPFVGEDWGLELASCAYVLASPGATVYLNADSGPTPEAWARIAREHRVDLAFLGVSGCAETYAMPPGYGYGGFYEAWVPAEKRNEWVALCAGPADAAEAAIALGARRAFGYAAGGASYFAPAFSDRGTHEDLEAELARRGRGELAARLAPGRPARVA